jgi:hypothetical protein
MHIIDPSKSVPCLLSETDMPNRFSGWMTPLLIVEAIISSEKKMENTQWQLPCLCRIPRKARKLLEIQQR